MPETGDAGFEGLVATLLSALTGDRFYVARSGDQPADAVISAADIAMQAKRYGKTTVDEKKFEGEFAHACRRIPNLDCYVFAVTRQHAQLRVLANDLQEREGVDVILLGFDGIDSELPALCVTYWQHVRHFTELDKLGDDFADWARSQGAEPHVTVIVSRLRDQLKSSVPLAAMVRRQLQAYLEIRFGIDVTSKRAVRFPIDLARAIRRANPHLLLNEWWRVNETRAALVVGEEGMGKSVVAAAFSQEISEGASALVLWLDSADWSGITTIEGIVASGLKHAGVADEKLRQRLARKALKRWSSHLLVVLDGLNEKGARETGHHLLADIGARGAASPRLLFTSRQVRWRADEKALWGTATIIPVQQFTDEELTEALGNLDPAIPIGELPASLLEVAKIPRYFKRAVELRAQFKSLRHVSREMVLWVDLLDKIDSGESQVTETIGWKSPADLKRAMTKLATAALHLPPGADISSQGYSVLRESFDDFDRTRLDLAEQRIVLDPTSDHPSVNKSHIILGFALHLGAIASAHGNERVDDLADRLRRELEPLLAQDYLTEALFVALQLSTLPTGAPYSLTSRARAALLFTWAASQNANANAERLAFWASHDPAAYLDFLEELFVAPVSDGWIGQLIEPLKLMWKAGNADPLIDTRLRSWLTLIWRRDLHSQSDVTEGKHVLRIARSQHQLILGNVALAILAENPVPTFLKDLAVAAATDHLSREEHRFTHPTSGKETTQDFPCKDLDNNLGPVLRWRFTERVKPELELLAAAAKDDSVLAKGANDLITSFDVFGWQWSKPNVQSIRDQIALFPCTAEEAANRFADIPEFAARDDLPGINSHDQEIIATKVEAAFSSPQLRNDIWDSSAAMDLDYYLAWFARYRPQRLSEIGATFRLKALSKEKAWLALDLANDLPYSRETVPPGELLRALKDLVIRTPEDAPKRYDGSLLEAHVLALTCFAPDDLQQWLVFAASHKRARAHIHFWQVHVFCRYITDDIAVFAREQAKRCCNEEADESDLSTSEFDYWAAIGGTAGPPDLNYHRWVDAEIRRRVPTGHRRFYWRLLWLRTAPEEVLVSHVADASIFEFFTEDGFRALLFANRGISDWTGLTASIDTLLELIPLDEVGAVLHLAKRDEDLARWGHVIFAQALERVGRPPFERQFWGTTILERDSAGRIGGSTCDRERPVSELKEDLRPKTTSFRDHAQHFSIEERNREANAALKVWHGDLDALRELDHGALSQFNALQALKAWRDQHPDEFKTYSKELLAGAVARPADAYHVGGFIAAVVDALLPLDPDRAYESHCALQDSPMRVSIVNDFGQPTFTAGLWACAKGGNERAAVICRKLCETAATDEEIGNLAITAVAEGGAETLLFMCNDLLGSDLAKQRALAVSLLAWVPLDTAVDRLRQLVQSDASGWVRTHAAWALEVAQHERASRQYYRDTLKVTDINTLFSRLQVLLPALTISTASWHRQVEDEELKEHTSKQIEAALSGFWYNFRHRSKTPPKKVLDRDLREYLRGERIRDLRAPKPRLLDIELN